MKPKLYFVIAVSLGVGSLPLFGQKPAASSSPSPSWSAQSFKMPDMGAMYSQMMNAMFSEYVKPERAEQLAHFQRLYYDALIKEGFTKEEAIQILKGSQPPMSAAK